MPRFTKLETEMILDAMEFVEAGEWPWSVDIDGTTPAREARERAAWKRAKEKLERQPHRGKGLPFPQGD